MNAKLSLRGTFRLGHPSMDATHQEFLDQVNRLNACSAEDFADLFLSLLEHTKAHFAAENTWMDQSGFPAASEHQGEHARVLGEMTRFAQRPHPRGIRLARAYVREQLPGWFKLHLITMDSALAAHLLQRQAKT
jgi:hemerythrin-like metal-binding protein